MTDLQEWLVGEVADAIGRLDGQVLSCVPPERRLEHPGGGSSITWVTFHIARHAALAAAVIDGAPILQEGGGFSSVIEGGAGLEEAEQAWVATLDDAAVGHFAHDVLARVRERLSRLSADVLESVPDTEAILEASDISRDRYGWLYDMWVDKPASFFVRWPLVGHVTNHVGEMIATRNRMGLSPF